MIMLLSVYVCDFNLAVEMGSGAVIYVPSFIKIGSVFQKLIGEDTQAHTDSNVIS
jgi:hypothetical protein